MKAYYHNFMPNVVKLEETIEELKGSTNNISKKLTIMGMKDHRGR